MQIKVWELKLKVYALGDLDRNKQLESTTNLIDSVLELSQETKELHNSNKFKNYTFGSLYPLNEEGIAKAGGIYTLVITTVDSKLKDYFIEHLPNAYNEQLKALVIESKVIPKRPIESIRSTTPFIIKAPGGYWRGNNSFDLVEERLIKNLTKKYKSLTGVDVNLDELELFNNIELVNKYPIQIKYKKITLLGDKLFLRVADNPIAQDLIYMAIGTGIFEMNARGLGGVNFQYVK